MMKRVLFTTMAALAISACSNQMEVRTTPVASDRPIRFELPIVAPTTRADATGQVCDNAFPDNWSFAVWAKWSSEAGTSWREATTTYMDAVTCSRVAGSQDEYEYDNVSGPNTFLQSWMPAQAYYWPKEGYLRFRAVYPVGTESDPVWAVPDETIASGEYVKTNTSYYTDGYQLDMDGDQPDLMFTYPTENRGPVTGTDGTPWNSDQAASRSSDGVQLVFQHALSNIRFQVKLKEDYTASARITLTGIQLTGMYKQGHFSYDEGLPDYKWTTENGPQTYNKVLIATNGVEIVNHAAFRPLTTPSSGSPAEAMDLLVLPQVMRDDTGAFQGQRLIVTYYIWTPACGPYDIATNRGIKQEFEVMLNTLTYLSGTTAFEIGKKYTYNIIFGLDEIYFSPEVTPWTPVTVTDITND